MNLSRLKAFRAIQQVKHSKELEALANEMFVPSNEVLDFDGEGPKVWRGDRQQFRLGSSPLLDE